jgi:DUF4097 and DUF4098 domain-containing protein YvlB
MKSNRSLAEILGIVLGVAAIALVVAALVYLLGARPFHRLRGPWWPRFEGSWSGQSGPWQSEEATEEVSQRVQRLEVNNVSGPVRVEGWDGDAIQVHYVKQARGSQALKNFRVEIQTDGDTLKVHPVYAPQAGFRFGPVSFDLKVPSTLRQIRVHSVSGRIEVDGLSADIDQDLESMSGSISSERSGNLTAKSRSGAIDFSFAGDKLYAKSISGAINGKIHGLSRSGSVEVETVSGSLNLAAFAGLDAELRLSSVSGSISCGFPLQISEQKRNRLEGRIGTGAAKVTAKSISGSINLSALE